MGVPYEVVHMNRTRDRYFVILIDAESPEAAASAAREPMIEAARRAGLDASEFELRSCRLWMQDDSAFRSASRAA